MQQKLLLIKHLNNKGITGGECSICGLSSGKVEFFTGQRLKMPVFFFAQIYPHWINTSAGIDVNSFPLPNRHYCGEKYRQRGPETAKEMGMVGMD